MKDIKVLQGFSYGEPEKRFEAGEQPTVSNADAEAWEAKGLVTILGDAKPEPKPDVKPDTKSAG